MSSDASSSEPKKRKVGSKACDACRIRKVRCSDTPPCERCTSIGIECTFNNPQATRGPRSLRPKTLRSITSAQNPLPAGSSATATADESRASAPRRTLSETLVLRLCIYRLRLFPVWPIVAVEQVIANLQLRANDLAVYALANAIGAATMEQLKLHRATAPEITDAVTAADMAAESQRARRLLDEQDAADNILDRLRTAFFLHVYHENLQPGGTSSLLLLREAVTLAQLSGLHRPGSDVHVALPEKRMRRRILWLLFVTERGVALLHNLPVVLNAPQTFPPLDIAEDVAPCGTAGPVGGMPQDDAQAADSHVLPAFRQLVRLFWLFDRSGGLDALLHTASRQSEAEHQAGLQVLQQRLRQEDGLGPGTDIQRADLLVTRQWMRVLLWRAQLAHSQASVSPASASPGPVQIAREFLDLVASVPRAALDAHGPSLEYKVYEISRAVADALQLPIPSSTALTECSPADVLLGLQHLLASCRGGNPTLLRLLGMHIAQIQGLSAIPGAPMLRLLSGQGSSWMEAENVHLDSLFLGTNTETGLDQLAPWYQTRGGTEELPDEVEELPED